MFYGRQRCTLLWIWSVTFGYSCYGVLSLNVGILCDDATSFLYEMEIQKTDESPLAIETNRRSILRMFALFYDRTSLFTSFGPVIRRESFARNHEKRGTGKSSRFSAILWLISWLVMQFSFRSTRVRGREFYQAWKSLLSEEIVRREERFILWNISS